MPEPKLSFDEFVQTATESALKAAKRQIEIGDFKVPPKIWIGIIVDPFAELAKNVGSGK
jgi:hypothetical protein